MKHYHHSRPTVLEGASNCAICGKLFKMYYRDISEKNGRSDAVTKKDGKVVHHSCAGGKSLYEINEERKKLFKNQK